MLRALAAIAATGCYHPAPSSGAPCNNDEQCTSSQKCIAGHCGGDGDAAADVAGDATDCASWMPHHFDACAIPPPGPDVVLTKDASPYELDTSAVSLLDKNNVPVAVPFAVVQQGGTPALLVAVNSLTLESDAKLRLIGARPAIVAAWHTLAIDGEIDAGSYRTVGFGAGANPLLCGPNAAATGQNGAGGAGGGGGGAFQGPGGHGGPGDSDGTAQKSGGGGGTAVAVPHIVRGGCGGANGGKDGGANAIGAAGGGAIQLTARDAIRITGIIAAGGAGGPAGTITNGGGAGGGAGGYIGLDAPMLTLTNATLAANGGGGGEGCGTVATAPGGDASANATPAAGGASLACGFAGGNGAASTQLDGTSVTLLDTCGGGGGGGGAGYILAWGTLGPTTTATSSPPAIANPF